MRGMKKKIERGYILHALHISYPTPIPEDALLTGFLSVGIMPDEVKKHLEYLVDKGYVERKEVEIKKIGIKSITYKLTPRGVDLVEGEIKDDTILLP